MMKNHEICLQGTKNALPNISNSGGSIFAEHEEFETFKATNISMLCLKCSNYVNLTSLEDHRTLHEALELFQYDFETKPSKEEALSQKRATLVKDLNELPNMSRSSYCRKLGKIDLAYEVIKSHIYGRSNKVKPSFIEYHDVIIRSVSAKLYDRVALGLCESTNEKWKSVMEDAYSYNTEVVEGRTVSCFSVFDGYSGATAAKKCASQFYQVLKETLSDFNFDQCITDSNCQLLDGFQQAFQNMDRVLLYGANETSRNRWSGCSATTCLLMGDMLHVANVGNVEAILIKDDDSFQILTEDHTPANKKEKHRIKANGDIRKWSKTMWVNGVVVTTRGLGNHGDPVLKLSMLNIPAICCTPVVNSHIILIASHGFWQVFDEHEAILLIKEWLNGNDELEGAENSRNSDFYNHSNSIKVEVHNEDVSRAEPSNTIKELKEEETLENNDLNTFKTEDNGRYENSNEPKIQRSFSELLRDLLMRSNASFVAVDISKHLMKAALTGGAKENITVMVVIPHVVSSSDHNEFR